VAGGSGGRSDLWTVGKKVVAANTNNGDIEGVRQSLHRIPVELHASGQSVDEALVQAVTQTTKPVAFFDQLHACDAGGRAERDGPRGVSVPGRRPCSWPPPRISGLETHAGTDVECANALGCVHFVPDDGEQVNVKLNNIYGELADRLGGIGVQQGAVLMGDGGEFGDFAARRSRCWRT
jgi:hypothetical protein